METFYILYKTTNLVNDKTYIGIHKTNNLDDGYLGSGFALLEAVEKYGKENFKREILEFCNSYDELLELEKIYVDINWVRDKSNYNLKTGGQSSGILSEESKNKISETLKKKYKNGEIIINRKNGIIPWNKGLNYDEEYRFKISEGLKGRIPWNKGLKGAQVAWNKGLKLESMTEEEKKKRSKTLKERWKNQEHHSKGVEPWNKGLKGVQVAWNKGIEMEKIECPHCGKILDKGNAKRWHFDNCKENKDTILLLQD
jgi:hypothetical protein